VNNSLLVVLIASGIAYGTPLLFASLGELLIRYRVRIHRRAAAKGGAAPAPAPKAAS